MKRFLKWIAVLMALAGGSAGYAWADGWSSQESGTIYVPGSGDSPLTQLPITKSFAYIECHPMPLTFTAAAGSTIVANCDFNIAYASTLVASAFLVADYWPYSQTFIPWVHIDNGKNFRSSSFFNLVTSWIGSVSNAHPNVYIGNTPTAKTSGGAASIGVTYRWETKTQDNY